MTQGYHPFARFQFRHGSVVEGLSDLEERARVELIQRRFGSCIARIVRVRSGERRLALPGVSKLENGSEGASDRPSSRHLSLPICSGPPDRADSGILDP